MSHSKTKEDIRSEVLRQLPPFLLHPAGRLPVLIGLHAVIFSAIYSFCYFARFDFEVNSARFQFLQATLPLVVAIKLLVFYWGQHFHGWWRYVTFADLKALLKASVLCMVTIAFLDYFISPFAGRIPRTTIAFDAMTTLLVIGGLRSIWRFADESAGANRSNVSPALLVGTDHEIGQLAAQINTNHSMPFRVVGLIAQTPEYRRKAVLGGVRVLGHLENVATLASQTLSRDIFVLAGTMDGKILRKLITTCNEAEINVRVLPRFEDAMSGSNKIPLRELNINDLLKRNPVQLDTTEVEKLITGKRVLITGAGGSIGSEISRQILRFQPAEMILLGRGENRIYTIYHELIQAASDANVVLHQEIGDITDRPRMERLFSVRQPEIVFHAAAHKHVPLMELHPGEAVKNNVMGTKVISTLADQHSASHFVMVSSDKAVNPTSIMGATKQLAERVVYDLAQTSKTKFATVRFGNVLGSAGSVIPKFQQQIRAGGPITITDQRMTRYFMSIPEASQLVIQSAAMCRGGEIYVLDMGEPVNITQLAEDLVTLSGLPAESIEFQFTGIRPGEKLYEELYFDDEATLPTNHPKVRAAYPREFQDDEGAALVNSLIDMADDDAVAVKNKIASIVTTENADPERVRALNK
ncbi:MAG: nucleoside-diphosphate sugar epimerase/dehydratase [Fuerstiella sp.]